jgi:hypothetical protein
MGIYIGTMASVPSSVQPLAAGCFRASHILSWALNSSVTCAPWYLVIGRFTPWILCTRASKSNRYCRKERRCLAPNLARSHPCCHLLVHPPGRSIGVQQELQHITAEVEASVAGIEDEMVWLNDDAFYGN